MYNLGKIFSIPLLGAIMARWGRRTAELCTAFPMLAGYLLLALAEPLGLDQVYWFYAGRFLTGTCLYSNYSVSQQRKKDSDNLEFVILSVLLLCTCMVLTLTILFVSSKCIVNLIIVHARCIKSHMNKFGQQQEYNVNLRFSVNLRIVNVRSDCVGSR